jgi:putative chitinase
MTINRPATFGTIKSFFGTLKQSQVDSFNLFFDEWDGKDKRHLAYILATVWHETAKTMLPIEEYGKGKGKAYSKLENGISYYGRGHVQVTWLVNYQALTRANKKGWEFVKQPELLLQNKPSIWATFYGMRVGLFTSKRLDHYFNTEKSDPINARRIINGTDKAELICEYYNKFLNSIQ